jgi:voltage-gated potassium channel
MAAIARFLIAGILLLILWGFGLIASYQADESGTLLSAIAMLVPGVVWLLVAAFALLAALSLYSPRPEVKINFLGYTAASYAMTIYIFSVIFLLINRSDTHAFTPAMDTLGTAAYFSIVTIATVGYGDIAPTSGLARLTASTEILIGVA